MSQTPKTLENVKVDLKANVYFDGKVVSHSVYDAQGQKKTLGLIYPGTYSFDTGKPELMVITAGECRALLPGEKEWKKFNAGQEFSVPGNSRFEIAVDQGIAEYLCVFKS